MWYNHARDGKHFVFMIDLPKTLPIFRVKSTILMPHAQLPVTMSEHDYLEISPEIVENNIVAIVQPRPTFEKKKRLSAREKSFKIGCAGKIMDVNFIADEVTMNIYGLCRFDVVSDIETADGGAERITVDYDRYLVDMDEDPVAFEFNKDRLMNALDIYFKTLEISPNWKEIRKTPVDVLVSALAMACPLHPSEKQSLLETVDIKERSDMITKIIEMNSHDVYNTASTVN